MTKFPSKGGAFGLLLLLALSGCVEKSGVPLDGALAPALDYAYIPLSRPNPLLPESDCGAVLWEKNVAVTAAHCADLLDPKAVLAVSSAYDLLFFRSDREVVTLGRGAPAEAEKVFAIAHYGKAIYRADGIVAALDAPVKARCESCAVQKAFVFDGHAGPGYSGGPVLDSESGRLIGIVFGYIDASKDHRFIYAYPTDVVEAEWQRLRNGPP